MTSLSVSQVFFLLLHPWLQRAFWGAFPHPFSENFSSYLFCERDSFHSVEPRQFLQLPKAMSPICHFLSLPWEVPRQTVWKIGAFSFPVQRGMLYHPALTAASSLPRAIAYFNTGQWGVKEGSRLITGEACTHTYLSNYPSQEHSRVQGDLGRKFSLWTNLLTLLEQSVSVLAPYLSESCHIIKAAQSPGALRS